MAVLGLAVALVKFIPFAWWRGTLGVVEPQGAASSADEKVAEHLTRRSRPLAARVERASLRMPHAVKCFPRAIALQWCLRLSGEPARLVIAVARPNRHGEDAFHAWVEQHGVVLIGQCERSDYQPIVSFALRHHAV